MDALINAGHSEQRAEFMDYSTNNFSNVWGQVFVPIDSKVESLFDLNNKTIALMTNDVNGIHFMSQCEQFEVACKYIFGNSYQELFQMVENGQVDGAVSNNLVGNSFQSEFSMHASSIVFNPFKVYITVPKRTNQHLLTMYDETLAAWKQQPDSFYYRSRAKWTITQPADKIPAWLWYSVLCLLLFGILAGLAAWLFKQQVRRRVLQLSQQEVQLNKIINIVPHMIFANDDHGNIILANDTACDFFGLDKHNITTKNIHNVLSDNNNYQNLSNYTLSSDSLNTELEVKDFAGQKKILMMAKVSYSAGAEAKNAVVTVGVDISQIKAYEKEILYLAHYEPLTGLPNRDLLKDCLKSTLNRAKQQNHVGAILHLDIDNFKNVNDSKGHSAGDNVIKKVALIIKSCIKSGNYIAHLGADEFIIVLTNLNKDSALAEQQAIETAKLVLNNIKTPIAINDKLCHITASIGLAIYPRDGTDYATLLKRADTAMFEAKHKGRNRIQVFNTYIESRVKQNLQLENDLRLALVNEQISLLYQPIFDAQTGVMVGSEALLRWQHPDQGVIMPTVFIPIAENAQLILEIGYWTIEQACEQIVLWQATTNKPFFLSVNLSVIQIRDDNFLPKVTAMMQNHQIPKHHLEFEITESILLNESKRSIEIINQLKQLGIKLSIDDFGTGYSSFSYLRRLPLDKIKIDKSFIKDIPRDNNSTSIVKSILSMAKEMQLEVVAEGVETAAQVEFLKQHHCQYFQGYYFARPQTEIQLSANHKF